MMYAIIFLQNMDSAGAVYGVIRLIISILKRNPDKILQACGLSNLQKQTEVPAHGGTGEWEYSECHQRSDTEHYFLHKGENCLTPLPARPLKA